MNHNSNQKHLFALHNYETHSNACVSSFSFPLCIKSVIWWFQCFVFPAIFLHSTNFINGIMQQIKPKRIPSIYLWWVYAPIAHWKVQCANASFENSICKITSVVYSFKLHSNCIQFHFRVGTMHSIVQKGAYRSEKTA